MQHTEGLTISSVVVQPLSIHDVVHGDHIIVFRHSTTSNTAQLLHVSANTENQTKVNTEGTDICSCFAGDPENTKITLFVKFNELGLMDRADTQLTLNSRNKGRALEESTGKGLECTGEGSRVG